MSDKERDMRDTRTEDWRKLMSDKDEEWKKEEGLKDSYIFSFRGFLFVRVYAC